MSLINQLAGGSPSKPAPAPAQPIGIKVIPYDANYDADADKFLPWFWQKLMSDETARLYFPRDTKLGFARFVKLFSGGEKVLIVTKVDSTGKMTDAVGFASWAPLPMGSSFAAIGGFIFLKEFWDGKTSDAAAHSIMNHWFTVDGLDIVIGNVAEFNLPAHRFLQRLGWKKVGNIPTLHMWKGSPCSSVLWYMDRDSALGKENHGQGK
jgi:RimJ/RimL family protein N-acetyltransferase